MQVLTSSCKRPNQKCSPAVIHQWIVLEFIRQSSFSYLIFYIKNILINKLSKIETNWSENNDKLILIFTALPVLIYLILVKSLRFQLKHIQ